MELTKEEIIAKVLIVDDIPENIYSLETLLTQDDMPITFLHATSGNEALKIAFKGDIALILLDVQMPEMDGYEVATILKQVKSCQNIPIIFVTALNKEAKYVTEGYSKGAIDYLFKPLDPFITRSKINSFINIYIQQKKLEKAHENLEAIVLQRTADLEQKNEELNTEIQRRTAAEEELNKYITKLINLNKDLDQFVYNASHDLKLPVANLEALVSALKEELTEAATQEVQDMLEMLDGSVAQLRNTIQSLIDIIKKEHDGIYFEKLDCEQILEEVKLSIAELIKDSNAEITHRFEDANFEFNRVAFKSILYNLITNSIKYKSPDRVPKIEINLWDEGKQFLLSVKDNGIGMSEEEQAKMFLLFERMHHDEAEGSGIGLYIVKKHLDKYGATVKVESGKNVGTTFLFTFKKV